MFWLRKILSSVFTAIGQPERCSDLCFQSRRGIQNERKRWIDVSTVTENEQKTSSMELRRQLFGMGRESPPFPSIERLETSLGPTDTSNCSGLVGPVSRYWVWIERTNGRKDQSVVTRIAFLRAVRQHGPRHSVTVIEIILQGETNRFLCSINAKKSSGNLRKRHPDEEKVWSGGNSRGIRSRNCASIEGVTNRRYYSEYFCCV